MQEKTKWNMSEGELCLKCGFMMKHHTKDIRKRNKKEGEPYPCNRIEG